MARRKRVKRIIKWALLPAVLFGLYVAIVLIYGTINDWKPAPVLATAVVGEATGSADSTFSFVSWNIGFAALGEETSFFYDGGDVVIQDAGIVRKNLDGVISTLGEMQDVDVFFLQEVDSCAKRSHRINQVVEIQQALGATAATFAMNYNVDFVPSPILEPFGEVRSGLLTLSRLATHSAERRGFDTEFEWPRRVFFLDRCFLKQHIDLDNGKELILLNTHCSAYDASGDMVRREIDMMIEFAQAEYEKGNYIIMGGDWNQCPPTYTPVDISSGYNEHMLSDDQIPEGWQWIADTDTPTNRKLDKVYDPEVSYTSVIDHYMVSPNVSVINVDVIDLQFQFSDHQPVRLDVMLQ